MRLALELRFKAVEDYIGKCGTPSIPQEFQSQLYRFGAVMVCGYVERSIEIIILDRLANRAHARVLNYIKSQFQRGTNFDCNAIGQLLARFDPNWYRKFQEFLDKNEQVREGISSCYAVRNSVAHGGASSVGRARLTEQLTHARALVNGIVDATQ